VNDAIQAAGGFSNDANTNIINLAALLKDGEQISVPTQTSSIESGRGMTSSGALGVLVNINTATLEELDELPEIGPVTAQHIVDYRNANGPFARIEDILDVPGVGQVTFDKIKSMISVDPSP
jgi:competence protein ComEA